MKKITALLLYLVGFGPAYGAKFQTLEEDLTQTAAKIAQNVFIPKNSKMAVVAFLESTSRGRARIAWKIGYRACPKMYWSKGAI